MNTLIVISILHFIEHVAQIIEVYVLHIPREKALGILGLFYPWLMRSETLHYALALYMLVAIWIFRHRFRNNGYWQAALITQTWHHWEHLLLVIQATTGYYLFGQRVPTSVGQLFFPKIELHFFYNLVVFSLMMLAIWKKRDLRLSA